MEKKLQVIMLVSILIMAAVTMAPSVNLIAKENSIKTEDIISNSSLVDVRFFGAKGNGRDDDTMALLLARDHVLANGGVFYVPQQTSCRISDSLNLFGLKNVRIEGVISGKSLNDAIILGSTSLRSDSINYEIAKVNNIGIKIQGTKNANIRIDYAPYVLLWADGDKVEITSIARCKFFLGVVNKLEINSQGAKNGWINENVFYGGRIKELIIDGNYHHNNNAFYHPALENVKIKINKGSSNYLYDCRFEGTNSVVFGEGTFNNVILVSWESQQYNYLRQSSSPATVANHGFNNYFLYNLDLVNSREVVFELHSLSANYDLSSFTKNANNLTIKKNNQSVFESDYIEINNPIGFITQSDKNFFRIELYIYDSNKNLIETEQNNFTSIIGGIFEKGHYTVRTNISNKGIPIFPNGNVKFVKLKLLTGNNVINQVFSGLKLVKIESVNNKTTIKVSSKYKKITHVTVPTEGYWETGDIVYNSDPKPEGYIGWICITPGNPGIWRGF